MDERPSTHLDLLTRRASVLRRLTESPAEKRDLVAALDVSRSTVDRSLRELAARDLVERVDGGYRANLAGRLLLESFDQFRDRSRGIGDAQDVLSVLPRDAPFPPDLFAGASIVRPSPVAPDRPAETNADLLSWADEVRGVISAVSERYVVNYREAVADGTSVAFVFPSPVLERLITRYDVDDVLGRDGVGIRETTASVPCSVKLHRRDDERIASIVVYGPEGLRGLVTNDAPCAVEWAESFIDRHWEAADALPMR